MFKTLFSHSPDAGDVDFETLVQAVEAGAVAVVDVREPHEFAAGRIPGAANLPLSRFDPGELPTGAPVVLICQAGGRSRAALEQARASGRGDVRHYPGGMSQWRAQGGPVEM
jgi:rhodanese-related sulfurtransferase